MTGERIDLCLRQGDKTYLFAWHATDGMTFNISTAATQLESGPIRPIPMSPFQHVEIRGDKLAPADPVPFDVVALQDEVRRLREKLAEVEDDLADAEREAESAWYALKESR